MQQNDTKTKILELKKIVLEQNTSQEKKPITLGAALCIDANKILEQLLWKKNENLHTLIEHEPLLKAKILDILGSLFVNLIQLSNTLDIDITEAFFEKMAANAKKYPIKNGKASPRKRWLEGK